MTSWTRTRLKNIATVNRRTLVDTTDPSFLFTYVDIGDVSQGSISINEKQLSFAESPSRARRLAETHDTVVSTVRTYLRAVALVPESESTLVFSTGFAVISPTSEVDPQFLCWYLQGDEFVSRVEANSTGVSYPAIAASQLMSMGLNLPDFSTQRAIADFLDRETSRIDTLIDEQEKLITLFRERQSAIWRTLFEESESYGVHATVRRVISSIVDGPFGSSLTSAHYTDDGTRVIRLGNIGVNSFRDVDKAYISDDYALSLSAHRVEAGDVVVAGLGDERMPLGRAAVVPDVGPAIVKADCYRIRPSSRVTSDYLAWVLCAPQTQNQLALLARGATRARLNTSVVQNVSIPLPPLEVQSGLVNRWQSHASMTSMAISEAERFIELSRERRAALITAAVTGQIDVREEVA